MAGVFFPQSFPYSSQSPVQPLMGKLPPAILGQDDPSQLWCRSDDSVTLSPTARETLSLQGQHAGGHRPEEIADRVGQGAEYVDAVKQARHSTTARAAGGSADDALKGVVSSADDVTRSASTRVSAGALRVAGPIGVAATVASSGLEAHQALKDPNANSTEKAERVGGAIGSGTGSLAAGASGAKIGLALGAAGGPPDMVVGAIVGGVGGAIAGSSVGRWLGEKAGGLFA